MCIYMQIFAHLTNTSAVRETVERPTDMHRHEYSSTRGKISSVTWEKPPNHLQLCRREAGSLIYPNRLGPKTQISRSSESGALTVRWIDTAVTSLKAHSSLMASAVPAVNASVKKVIESKRYRGVARESPVDRILLPRWLISATEMCFDRISQLLWLLSNQIRVQGLAVYGRRIRIRWEII